MNKRTGKRLGASLVFLFFLLTLTVSAVFAWFNNPLETSIGATSYVHKSYFESGDGTSATQYQTYDAQGNPVIGEGLTSDVGCAFEIKYPVQLYYFAWLQNLGYFNTPDEETGVISPVYFYISDDLDMSEFVLPPIGTAEYPFIGAFNGNGHTITNLHVTNDSSVTDKPSEGETGAQIVGFFGVVGSYNGSATPNNHVASVENFTLNGVNIETSAPLDNESLIGVAAGYVNGVMDSVAIANSTVTVGSGVSALGMPQSESGGGTDNLSDYALVGYCTQPYRMQLNVTKVTLAAPVETQNVIYKNTQNEGPGFGGSIQMKNLYNRLNTIRATAGTSTTANSSYVSAETVDYDEATGVYSEPYDKTTTSTIIRQRVYTSSQANPTRGTAGSFSFSKFSATQEGGTSDASIIYLYGKDDSYTKQVTTITKHSQTEQGYTISDGNGHYLNLNASHDGFTTDGTPTVWIFNNSRLYTYTTDGHAYYIQNDGAIVEDTAPNTSWVWSNNRYSSNNGRYYLVYDNGWLVSPTGSFYVITDGNGNYLRYAGSLSNTTVFSQATHWEFSNTTGTNPQGYISTSYNNRTYYLYVVDGGYWNADSLGATTSTSDRTDWSNNGSAIYNGSNYIQRSGNSWDIGDIPSYYTIRSGSNYLNATSTSAVGTGPSVSDLNDASGNTLWQFSTSGTNPSGRISTIINGTTYYLYRNGTNLQLSTSNTSWSNTSGRLYYRSGRNYYNIRYNNGWGISQGNNTGSATTLTISSASRPISKVELHTVTPTDITQTQATAYVYTRSTATVPADYPADTYFPLNVKGIKAANGTISYNAENDSIEVEDTNTGYIVSGSSYHNSDWPYRSGDIRVSQYTMSNISVALNQNNYSDARLEVITGMDNGTYSGWYRVSDSYNANNNNVSTDVRDAVADSNKINYKTLGFKRYEDARKSMSETFSGSSNIYGLHFMNAVINKDDYVIIPEASIEGENMTNLKVPRHSIDFNVKRRGFITVFAGTYFTGNNAFFSLHRIFRDDDNNITDIKEISQIYKPKTGDDYIYKYADDTYSDGKSASDCGSIAFDMKYMTDPSSFVDNAVYYFEIPVNGGEFALGSVEGKQGAYLFYLDIAANGGQAEDKDRVTISERFTEQNYDVTLPRGVQLIDANGAYDATKLYETVTVELADGYTGAYTLNRAGTVFDYTETANATLTYIGGELVAGSGGTTVNYYPNGYTVTYVENITDTGRATNLVDKLRIETVDTYNSSGQITGDRVVTLYAGIELTDDESQFVRIVEFRYVLSGHENMKTRIVRAASEGGFNVVFDSTLTLTGISITDERVHVNFGDNTSNYMKVFTSATLPTSSVTMDSYTVINMSDPANKPEEVYYPAVFGPDVAAYYSYVEGGDGVERATDPALTTSPIPKGTTSATQSLNYGVTLSSPTAITVYATQLLNSYSGTTYVENAAGTAAQSASYAVNPVAIDFNGTALEYNVPKRIDITAS